MFRVLHCILAGLSIIALSMNSALADDRPATNLQRINTGDAVAGQEKSRTCQECHGEDGNSTTAGYPKLAGQYPGYLLKQLRDFRSGARRNPFMDIMAAKIEESDLTDIVAWFAGQKQAANESARDSPIGRNLYINGDRKRKIPACASCHGEDGKGLRVNGVTSPVIGGQHRFYLREQLLNWNLGKRTNSPDVMNTISKALTDAEIDALADYVAGLE